MQIEKTHRSDDLCHEIIVVGFGDLAAIELTRFRVQFFGELVDKDLAVDFGSVHGKESDCHIELFDCEHVELPEMRKLILGWMDEFLVTGSSLRTC